MKNKVLIIFTLEAHIMARHLANESPFSLIWNFSLQK